MFFKKKREELTDLEKLQAQHQVVVFNLLDHHSVMAANLYKASSPLTDVTLVDIRDPIIPADSYLFLGIGGKETVYQFYNGSISPQQLTEVIESSVFVEGPDLMEKLSGAVAIRAGGVDKAPLLSKWSISAKLFHDNSQEFERIVRYYTALDMCYNAYAKGSDASEELASLSPEATTEEIEKFKVDQKEINKGLARKIRFITYPMKDAGGILPFHQFATMDPMAYSIIRRCISAGKNYLQTSMSVYGQVVFSNKLFTPQTYNHGSSGNILFIQGH